MPYEQTVKTTTGDDRHRHDPMKREATCIADDLDNGEFLIRLSDVPAIPWIPRKRGSSPLSAGCVYRWTDCSKLRRHRKTLECTVGT